MEEKVILTETAHIVDWQMGQLIVTPTPSDEK